MLYVNDTYKIYLSSPFGTYCQKIQKGLKYLNITNKHSHTNNYEMQSILSFFEAVVVCGCVCVMNEIVFLLFVVLNFK